MTRGGLAAVSGTAAAAACSAADPAEAHAEGNSSGKADLMGAVMATTVASLIATEYAIQCLEQPAVATDSAQSAAIESTATVQTALPPDPPQPAAPVQPVSKPTLAAVPQSEAPVVPVPQQTGKAAETPELSPPASRGLSTWPFACSAVALVGGAFAIRRKRAHATVTRRLATRPLLAQTYVTVAERQALRKARSDKWYGRLPVRTPGEVRSPEPATPGRADQGQAEVGRPQSTRASAAGDRTPRLWRGEGDLRRPTTAGPVTRVDYSAYALPALVRTKPADLIALLSSMPARGVERMQQGSNVHGGSARTTGPRTPTLAVREPDSTPLPPKAASPPPTAETDSSDSGTKAASVALLRDLADALSAQRGTLAIMFAEVDEDDSVSLDKDELRGMITQNLGVELGDREMEIIWTQLDADGSVRYVSCRHVWLSAKCKRLLLFFRVLAVSLLCAGHYGAGRHRPVGISYLGTAYVSDTHGSDSEHGMVLQRASSSRKQRCNIELSGLPP